MGRAGRAVGVEILRRRFQHAGHDDLPVFVARQQDRRRVPHLKAQLAGNDGLRPRGAARGGRKPLPLLDRRRVPLDDRFIIGGEVAGDAVERQPAQIDLADGRDLRRGQDLPPRLLRVAVVVHGHGDRVFIRQLADRAHAVHMVRDKDEQLRERDDGEQDLKDQRKVGQLPFPEKPACDEYRFHVGLLPVYCSSSLPRNRSGSALQLTASSASSSMPA